MTIPTTLRMLKVLLQKHGHEASAVFDGPSAIDAVARQQPDVVLLDLCLPGMSGIEVAAQLRCDPARSPAALVAVSGHHPDMLPSPSPFDRYFAKPVDFASLLAYLSEIGARQSWAHAVA